MELTTGLSAENIRKADITIALARLMGVSPLDVVELPIGFGGSSPQEPIIRLGTMYDVLGWEDAEEFFQSYPDREPAIFLGNI